MSPLPEIPSLCRASRDEIQLSVIIPAYNEEERLPSYLDSTLSYMGTLGITFEIIVIDDGSRDGTALAVTRLIPCHPELQLITLDRNRGKGHAVKTGMLAARGRFRLFADADGATPIQEVIHLLNRVSQGYDIAIASRVIPDPRCTVTARLSRRLTGAAFNTLVALLTVRGFGDTQCGFKLFTAESAIALFPLQRIDRYGFDVEILFLAQNRGLSIAQVPVNWRDIHGSKVSLVKDSIRMFLELVTIRINFHRGRYL